MRHGSLLALLLSVLALSLVACGGSQRSDRSQLLAVGTDAPALVRVDHRGKVVALRSGEPTLVYFYPKDGTPGCTKEACAFRDSWDAYTAAGVRVIGVSTDSEESHRAFAKEHDLPFSLIADPERAWSDAFGVPRFFGSKNARVSFLIDGRGRVAKVYEDVDPGVHASEVLADARQLGVGK